MLQKTATSSHDWIAVIPHIVHQVVINITETCCSICGVEDSQIGMWADNVGWVGEVDNIDGRLANVQGWKKTLI